MTTPADPAPRAPDDASDRPDALLTQVRVEPPERTSVGLPAIRSATGYAWREMGARRSLRTLLRINHEEGFDCPSCAWPDPDHRQHVEFCENGAKAVAWEATRRRVGRWFFAAHSVADLRQRDGHWLESQGRLTEPMYLAPGATHYAPIAWDEAISLVARRIRAARSPDANVFYTSGRASNEAAFAYQLLARRIGTNNLPDCSNMCHESSGAALSETIGVGKGTVSLADLSDHADLIVIVGQNPGTNHPRMLAALEAQKRRGGRIVAINPLPEAGLLGYKNPQRPRGFVGRGQQIADVFVPVRVNGDLALFNALNRRLVELDDADPGSVLDRSFIGELTTGFDAVADAWRQLDPGELLAMAGITAADLDALVTEVSRAERIVVTWAMGLTQHRNAVATIREIVNFLLLRGNIGRPGAGACPVRGHSNVQGDRTMGIWERMPDRFLDRLGAEFGFEPPRRHGWDTVEAIRAMADGAVDVFMALGGNFAEATPDTAVTEAALARCGLTVQVSTKLNRSHLCHGNEALILPCLGRTERDRQASGDQFVTVEDSMSFVHRSQGVLEPGSDGLRSEVAIVTALGSALYGDADIDWSAMGDDYAVIRSHIAQVVDGFEDFEERVRDSAGFTLPNAGRARTFLANGRARFTVNEPSIVDVPPGHLILQSVRSHDQFNTTVYGLDDRYRGISGGRRVVFVNTSDLVEAGFADGDLVDLVGRPGDDGAERRARGFRVVAYPTPPGCAAAYFPEVNVLVPLDDVAVTSNTPVSKSIVVRLEAAAPPVG